MSNQTGFFLDTTNFSRDFFRIATKTIPDMARKAIFKLHPIIYKDCINDEPKVPTDKKFLRSTFEIHPDQSGKLEATIGFNSEYAAHWHELPPEKAATTNWTLPGSGPKFLESKMQRHKDKYIKFVADNIHA